MAAGDALMNSRRRTPPGVEPGVTGKERRWQQNRQFGPGAFVPYPNASPTRRFNPKPIPNVKSAPRRTTT